MEERYVQILTHGLDAAWASARTVNPWFAALGVVAYLFAQAVRCRGWHTILRATYPEASQLKPRHTMSAYLIGAGMNGLVPARGGDVLKLRMLRRRIPNSNYLTLVATFAPETLGETTFGMSLLVWAAMRGLLPVPTPQEELRKMDVVAANPLLANIVVVTLAAILYCVWRIKRRGYAEFRRRLRQGVRILHSPRDFVIGVLSWQSTGRLLRLGSIAALLGAYHMPVTLTSITLVMAAQGSDHIVPFAGISVAVRIGLITTGIAAATGEHVELIQTTAYVFGSTALLMAGAFITAIACLAAEFELYSPVRVVGHGGELVIGAVRSLRAAVDTHNAELAGASASEQQERY
jgi:uncharacterized membrane protein YbhN (UPF0104 family)